MAENRQEPHEGYFYIIPAKLVEISPNAYIPLLYGLINSLCNKEGYCWASNDFLAKTLGKSIPYIKKNLNWLITKTFLVSEVNQKEGNTRRIYLNTIPVIAIIQKTIKNKGIKLTTLEGKTNYQKGGGSDTPVSEGRIPQYPRSDTPVSTYIHNDNDNYTIKRKRASDSKFLQIKERVKLTQKQYDLLKSQHSPEALEWILNKLNSYKTTYNQEYTSDFKAINKWVIGAWKNYENLNNSKRDIATKNKPIIKEIQEALERGQKRAGLKLDGEEAIDTVLGKSCRLTNPEMPRIVANWYGWNWVEEKYGT